MVVFVNGAKNIGVDSTTTLGISKTMCATNKDVTGGEMGVLEAKRVLFSNSGEFFAIAQGDRADIFRESEKVASVSGRVLSVSNYGDVLIKRDAFHTYMLSLSGEEFPLPPPKYYGLTCCFAAEPIDEVGGTAEIVEVCGQTIIRLSGEYAEHFPPFLIVTDGKRSIVRYRELVEWHIVGTVGAGKSAVFYAHRKDVYLFHPLVGLYVCSFPTRVRKIRVGKTWAAVLCDDGRVYVFPAGNIPAEYKCIGGEVLGIHWKPNTDTLICVDRNGDISLHSFPERTPPNYYTHEDLISWGEIKL